MEVMLILSRKVNESVIIRGGIKVMVVSIRGDKVRLGFEAPDNVAIHREEIQEAINRDKQLKDGEIGSATESLSSFIKDKEK